MLIDWFTVAAQIINFLVLVGILKYFLYGRITRAMREREDKIAARLEEALEREQEARQELEKYQKQNEELARKREQMLAQAREEAELERKKLLREAREEVDRAKARWHETLAREKDAFLADLRQRAGHLVFEVARRALADLANADLEEHIVRIFSQRLKEIDADKLHVLHSTLQRDRNVVIVSSFELSEEAKETIAEILRRHSGNNIKLNYRVSPEVISGIELKIPGHKIAWSLDHYLESLEEDLRSALEEET
ncbi:MAG: F0F1 ATP synthase subunit delta [Deltaproteobacteria bacterium]|nr:F0F1 ATP synthase subunit delta [Deltaproteobacteria bacterium]